MNQNNLMIDSKMDQNNLNSKMGLQIDQQSLRMDREKIGTTEDSDRSSFVKDVSEYRNLAKIGQGTFGEVFKAQHKITRRVVALKKILMEHETEGFPITALREIKVLQIIRHRNIVELIGMRCSKATVYNRGMATFYIVFEFCEHDLAGLLANPRIQFELRQLKSIVKQLLEGLFFIHTNNILHRDMKASNILITKDGVLKLADFGLSRAFSPDKEKRLTNRVVTLWYRPPEILLGSRNYGPEIDMWGVGCIMAELWTRSPIMQGVNEQDQLFKITQLCGSITPESFPDVVKLELYNKLELRKDQQRKVKERLRGYVRDEHGVNMIDQLLTIDPTKRPNADDSLNHDFLWTDPLPGGLNELMSKIQTSMFELHSAKRKQMEQAGPPPKRMIPEVSQYRDTVY